MRTTTRCPHQDSSPCAKRNAPFTSRRYRSPRCQEVDAQVRNVAGITVALGYPSSKLDIPGAYDDPSVLDRVTNLTGISGLFGAGDIPIDVEESILNAGLVSLGAPIPAGDFLEVDFDCVGPVVAGLGDLTCIVDVTTLEGDSVLASCELTLETTPPF